jgi:hypothetical protein
MAGDETDFFVALAYERAVGGAEPAATVGVDALAGEDAAFADWAAIAVGLGAVEIEVLIRNRKGGCSRVLVRGARGGRRGSVVGSQIREAGGIRGSAEERRGRRSVRKEVKRKRCALVEQAGGATRRRPSLSAGEPRSGRFRQRGLRNRQRALVMTTEVPLE